MSGLQAAWSSTILQREPLLEWIGARQCTLREKRDDQDKTGNVMNEEGGCSRAVVNDD